jgi:hypothetical protein
MIKRSSLVVVFLAVTLASAGCGKGKVRYGEAIPGSLELVKLKQIIEAPDVYKDKEVVLEGNYGSYCCPSDFSYKEGTEAMEVAPKGFPTPRLDRGEPVRIYGIVRSIEKKAEPGEGEEKEEDHNEVYIEAKGVEVR